MKILHLCLACFFPDNYSYQENMLPKFHKKLGYDVEVIASLSSFDKNGKPIYIENASTYNNEYKIKVTRLNNKKPVKINRKLKRYIGTYEAIEKAHPDIIFIHGCQFMDVSKVIKYLNFHRNVKVFVDNHADFSNSATNFFSKNILHKVLWRYYANRLLPYVEKFYGVLPSRVEFLENIYKLPKSKVELLVMGADDEKVKEGKNIIEQEKLRKKFNISKDDFLVVTGGKIDKAKKQTFLLMKAIEKIKNPNVKLLIFGSVAEEMQKEFNSLCIDNKIIYAGWIKSEESYKYFSLANLVVFPGRHSVFWEQVTGQGIPMICKYWDGTTHVNLGENVEFLYKDSVDEIYEKINNIITNKSKLEKMKKCAEEKGMSKFSYKNIAEYSIS